MGNENQNVLDFLSNTNNGSGYIHTPSINNSNKPKNNKILIIGIIIVIGVLLVGFISNSIKSSGSKKNKEPNDTTPKAEMLSYKTDVILLNETTFSVNTSFSMNYISNMHGVQLFNPKEFNNRFITISNIKMSATNMNTFDDEDNNYYYFKFGNNYDLVTGKKNHNLSYLYEVGGGPGVPVNDFRYIFIDKFWDYTIPKFELKFTIDYSIYSLYDYEFNRDMNCNTKRNTVTCTIENLEPNEEIYATFYKKELYYEY